MTAPVQTVGPADPNGGFRAKTYTVIGAIGGIVTLLQTFHLISDTQAASVAAVGSNIATLITSVGVLFAAFKTSKQVKNGTFDPVPEPDPVQVANDALKQIADKAASSAGDLDAVTQAAASVLPGLIIGGASAVEKAIADAVAAK